MSSGTPGLADTYAAEEILCAAYVSGSAAVIARQRRTASRPAFMPGVPFGHGNRAGRRRAIVALTVLYLLELWVLRTLYPLIEPYEMGMLDVGDGNLVYWEVCGNPHGKPALVVHGGPGSGCGIGVRRYFDPDRYCIVLFDQRGCGRSTPHASDPAADMRHNTTRHLIGDMERLREHLGIERWLLYGGSWGSTLILAYAEQYPRCVSAIVIAAVTMTRRSEIEWLYRGVGRFFPEQWEHFLAGAPGTSADGDIVGAYARLMEYPDLAVRKKAAADWCAWEDASPVRRNRRRLQPV